MGMDVYGKAPLGSKGEYFRNNVWWWRPLWEYCETVAPHLTKDVSGHTNDGDGLGKDGAEALGRILEISLSDGTCEAYKQAYYKELSELPNETCKLCEGTGVRTDGVGKESGMDTKVLSDDLASVLGRTTGWCNGCDGNGWKPHWATHYPFSEENVKQFAEFLAESGGFEIC